MMLRGMGWMLLAVWSSAGAWAQDPLVLSAELEAYEPWGHIALLEDPSGEVALEQIADTSSPPALRIVREGVPAFGYTTSTVWLRLPLVNLVPQRLWLLEVYNKSLDRVEAYVPEPGGTYELLRAGDSYSFYDRPVRHRNFIFPLRLPEGEVQPIFLRVASNGPLTVPLKIWSEAAFLQKERLSQFFLGAFFGVLLIMAAYNFFLFVAIRDRSYLFYVLYIASYLAYQLAVERIGFEYAWPEELWWQERANSSLALLTLVMGIQFTRSFLHTPQWVPRMDRLLIGLMVLAVPMLVLHLAGPRPMVNRVVVTFFLAVVPVVLAAGVLCWRRGNRVARYYLLAWTCLLGGAVVVLLRLLDVLPYSFWSTRSLQVGSALEVTLLSLGLGYRYNVQRKMRERMRLQIASDLHDEIGSGLTQISLYSELATRSAGDGLANEWAERVGQHARSLISNMQDIVWAVRPEQESWEALELRIKDFAAGLLAPKQIAFEMDGEVGYEHGSLPPIVRRNVLLIVKEALHNAVRHAECTRLTLHYRLSAQTLWLRLCDDGHGFDPAAAPGGYGLRNLRQRAAQIDADLALDTAPGEGTCIVIEVPLVEPARQLPE